jgi:excisionase family DNA binding protein
LTPLSYLCLTNRLVARTTKSPAARKEPARRVSAVRNGKTDIKTRGGTDEPKLLRLTEAAGMLSISRWYLNTLIDDGEIGIVRLGKNMRRVPMTEVERVLRVRFERRPSEGRTR